MIHKRLSELSIHPQASIVPDGTIKDNEDLQADIALRGVEIPLEIKGKGVILDGRRRFNAAKALGLKTLPCIIINEADEIDFMLRRALLRRNLTEFAKMELMIIHFDYLAKKGKEAQRAAGGALPQNSDKAPLDSNKEIGKLVGTSHDTVGRFRYIAKHGSAENKVALREDRKSINEVYEETKTIVNHQKRERQSKEAKAKIPNYTYNKGDGYENKIICGDNRLILKQVPDNKATMVIFSPPYATPLVKYDVYEYTKYWKLLKLTYEVIRESYRVLREGGRLIIDIDNTSANEGTLETANTGKRDMAFDLKRFVYATGFKYFDDAIWFKQNTVGSQSRHGIGTPYNPTNPSIRHNCENILMFHKGARALHGDNSLNEPLQAAFDHFTISAWNYDAKNKTAGDSSLDSFWYLKPEKRTPGLHPCPFPTKLVELCLQCLTRRGDLVIDPFNGSGTTTSVAQRLGRRFLGIDISEAYCAEAQARLTAQPQKPKRARK